MATVREDIERCITDITDHKTRSGADPQASKVGKALRYLLEEQERSHDDLRESLEFSQQDIKDLQVANTKLRKDLDVTQCKLSEARKAAESEYL